MRRFIVTISDNIDEYTDKIEALSITWAVITAIFNSKLDHSRINYINADEVFNVGNEVWSNWSAQEILRGYKE